MKGKVLGIPIVLLILAAMVIVPLALQNALLSQKMDTVRQDVMQTRISTMRCLPTVEAMPTATPSATATPAPRVFVPTAPKAVPTSQTR